MGIPVFSKIQFLLLELFSGDVSAPVDGQAWYNNTTGKFRARENGVTKDMISAGGAGGLSDANYGDITVSGGATVFTVAPEKKYGLPIAIAQNAFLI